MARAQRRQQAVLAQRDGLDGFHTGQAGDNHVHLGGQLTRRRRPARAGRQQRRGGFGAAVVDEQRMACLEQVLRHGHAHHTQADEAYGDGGGSRGGGIHWKWSE